jgi:hypothetical protein
MPQSFIGHYRAEIGSADADIDNVADALAGVSFPSATTDAVAERRHFIEDGVNVRDHVFAIDKNGLAFGGAKSYVQDSAIFSDIDFITAEHGIDMVLQTGFLGEIEKQLESFIGDAILRIIEEYAECAGGKLFAAAGVLREELTKMGMASFCEVGL